MDDEERPAHEPVLVRPILDFLGEASPRVVLDGTVGLGGHAEALLSTLEGIRLYIGIDRDPAALEVCRGRLARFGARVQLVHGRFSEAGEVLDGSGVGSVDAILLDLGPSNLQLLDPSRGFSFSREGPLDMRMDPGDSMTGLELIRTLPLCELARVLARWGELAGAGRIARAIRARVGSIRTTTDLAGVVAGLVRRRPSERTHPATRVFLALRIAVNREIEELEVALPPLLGRLSPAGRIAVLSFHSLEDRVVKHTLAGQARGCVCPPQLALCRCGRRPTIRVLTPHPVRADAVETAANPRSRSARLRVAQALGDPAHA